MARNNGLKRFVKVGFEITTDSMSEKNKQKHFIHIRKTINSQFICRPSLNPSLLIEALINMLQIFSWSVVLLCSNSFLNSQHPLLPRHKTPQHLTALRSITATCKATPTLSKTLFNSHNLHPTLIKGFPGLPFLSGHYYS